MDWIPLLQIAIPVGLMLIGFFGGRHIEQRHYRSIRARERELQPVIALNTRCLPEGVEARHTELLTASVVVSSDYFKTFVAGLRSLFGGRFRSYESLLDRARREALLRLKQQARTAGCDLIIGLRYCNNSVAGHQTPCVEVMAYGTAIHRHTRPHTPTHSQTPTRSHTHTA